MSQPNRVGRRISPRSLAGHERLPVRLSHVASANRYNEMSLCSISLYRAAGQARCYASVAKRHIAYQQVFKIPSASASTRPHGLRKPAARYRKPGASKRRIVRRIDWFAGMQEHNCLKEKVGLVDRGV